MIFAKKHTCEMCGLKTAAHNRDVRFRLPDPVLESPEQHLAEESWLSDPDPNKATLMQIPNIGPFVRALLPVKLEGGHEFRFGVWIAIHPRRLPARLQGLERTRVQRPETHWLSGQQDRTLGPLRRPGEPRRAEHGPHTLLREQPEPRAERCAHQRVAARRVPALP